jgi:L-threonylcarbamoyladenylate synthase
METRIGKDLLVACRLLQEGSLVAIPTETVYGLAGNALSMDALAAIYSVKNRPRFNPLILHLASWEQVSDYVLKIPDAAIRLAKQFSPGPITFLLPKNAKVADLLTAGSNLVAVRIPGHPLALDLLRELDFPLAAPSANPFGYISPTSAAHVLDNLAGKIPYILDGGVCRVGIESTIVGFDERGDVILYREGGISRQEIEQATGVQVFAAPALKEGVSASSPGRLKSHYAPSVSLVVGDVLKLLGKYSGKRVGVISFRNRYDQIPDDHQMVLSEQGNINEAASRLFEAMHLLDRIQPDIILAEVFPEEGLGAAINDRLSRAAATKG